MNGQHYVEGWLGQKPFSKTYHNNNIKSCFTGLKVDKHYSKFILLYVHDILVRFTINKIKYFL